MSMSTSSAQSSGIEGGDPAESILPGDDHVVHAGGAPGADGGGSRDHVLPREHVVPPRRPDVDPSHFWNPDYRRPLVVPEAVKGAKDLENFHRAVREGTYLAAKGPLPPNVTRFSLGKFGGDPDVDGGKYRCNHCKAWFFPAEIGPDDKQPYRCCSNGRVPVSPPNPFLPNIGLYYRKPQPTKPKKEEK